MQGLVFHEAAEDSGHFYVLAYCEGACVIEDERIASRLAMCFSPSAPFARFSFHGYTLDGDFQMYLRGPDYPSSVEAALLDIWVRQSVPIYSWHLYPREECSTFVDAMHEDSYFKARRELCVALYAGRVPAWTQRNLNVVPHFHPPAGGFIPVNAEQSSDKAELLQAAVSAAPN